MRSGLMGGTFDPIHLGHLDIAQKALDQLKLDRVIFLPDGDPPHKTPRATGAQRLKMCELACEGRPGFEVSDMELRRLGTTYTVDTLRAIKRDRPDEQLVYLIGSDTLCWFPAWKTAHEVARLCRMAVVLRPGDDRARAEQKQAELKITHGLDSVMLEGEGLPISSGMVREAAQSKENFHRLVPAKVADYIEEQGLYKMNAEA